VAAGTLAFWHVLSSGLIMVTLARVAPPGHMILGPDVFFEGTDFDFGSESLPKD
jgi:hypothetical protein